MMIEAKIQKINGSLIMPLSEKLLKFLEFNAKEGDILYLVPAGNGDLKIRKPFPKKQAMKTLITTADYLNAYSRGQISSGDVIRGLDMEGGFRELLELMSELELPLPRGQGEEDIVRKEVENAVPILKKQLELVEMKSAETELPGMDQ